MAELNLDQITDALKGMFTPNNHFVFWYDDEGAFDDNIAELQDRLDVPIVRMAPDEQFKTKLHLLSIQQEGGSALVYSPAPMPQLKVNFLADFLRFSKTYTADATAMLREELQLPADKQEWLVAHQSFFASKERKERFQRVYRAGQDPSLTILAVLSRADEPKLSSVLRAALHDSLDDENAVLAAFAKYDLLDQFWDFIARAYGYQSAKPGLLELMTAIMLNFAFDEAQQDLPRSLASYQLTQVTNAISFVQNSRDLKSSEPDITRYANAVWKFVNAEGVFKKLDIAQLNRIDAFPQIDGMIIRWMIGRLLDGDIAVRVGEATLDQVIDQREKMAFHGDFEKLYEIIRDAVTLLRFRAKGQESSLEDMIADYTTHDYTIDTTYRHFVANMMSVEPDQSELFEDLRPKVENAYLNDYLSKSIHRWNDVYSPQVVSKAHLQRKFYSNFVTTGQQRTVVIISDAFRFEAAKELQSVLDGQDKFETNMDWMVTGLPSVTYFGMPALMPNHQLDYDGDKKVLVDGQLCDSLEKRRRILQAENPASQAALVTDFLAMTTAERKTLIGGQQVVYLYHNKIDVTGESAKTESQVFGAVSDTIDTLNRTIQILRNISVRDILVTADHGFIYRWAPIDEANKIDIGDIETMKKEQRYAVSSAPIKRTGVGSQRLGDLLGNDDGRYVNYPTNFNIFKAPGASQNYVHGGASVQEMVVPALRVMAEKGKSQSTSAKIHDVTANTRITALQVPVRIMQDEAISDVNTAAHYSLYFADDQQRKISGVISFVADIEDTDPNARIKMVRLALAEQQYVNGKTYHLVMHNDDTGVEEISDYQMDIVIQGGFGFDI